MRLWLEKGGKLINSLIVRGVSNALFLFLIPSQKVLFLDEVEKVRVQALKDSIDLFNALDIQAETFAPEERRGPQFVVSQDVLLLLGLTEIG